MANEEKHKLINADDLLSSLRDDETIDGAHFKRVKQHINAAPAVVNGRIYNAHDVAEIIAELFGDTCACSFNSIDEWLPFKCELQDACPNPVGVACWEQYLKYRDAKMDGGNEDA